MAQTTLRNTLGTKTLTQVLSERESISEEMQNVLDEATDPWGITVERVEVKDVVLPSQVSSFFISNIKPDLSTLTLLGFEIPNDATSIIQSWLIPMLFANFFVSLI